MKFGGFGLVISIDRLNLMRRSRTGLKRETFPEDLREVVTEILDLTLGLSPQESEVAILWTERRRARHRYLADAVWRTGSWAGTEDVGQGRVDE